MMGTFGGYMQGILAQPGAAGDGYMADEQRYSSEKTEDPTQKRLDDAIQRGDVVKSQEVSTWFIIAGATLVLVTFSGGMGASLTTTMRGLIANSYDIRMDGPALPRPVREARRRTVRGARDPVPAA